MKILFDLTCLNDISFLFVADYKLLLLCLGCQTATSTYPCPFCLVHLRDITSSVDATGDELSENLCEERSFGMLHDSHEKFESMGGSKKHGKLCNSTVASY